MFSANPSQLTKVLLFFQSFVRVPSGLLQQDMFSLLVRTCESDGLDIEQVRTSIEESPQPLIFRYQHLKFRQASFSLCDWVYIGRNGMPCQFRVQIGGDVLDLCV